MLFFRNIGEFINTVEKAFLTVKRWPLNVIHSVYIIDGIFMMNYRINIIYDRENIPQIYGKLNKLIWKIESINSMIFTHN